MSCQARRGVDGWFRGPGPGPLPTWLLPGWPGEVFFSLERRTNSKIPIHQHYFFVSNSPQRQMLTQPPKVAAGSKWKVMKILRLCRAAGNGSTPQRGSLHRSDICMQRKTKHAIGESEGGCLTTDSHPPGPSPHESTLSREDDGGGTQGTHTHPRALCSPAIPILSCRGPRRPGGQAARI